MPRKAKQKETAIVKDDSKDIEQAIQELFKPTEESLAETNNKQTEITTTVPTATAVNLNLVENRYIGGSLLKLTREEEEILSEKVNPENIEIRPDGLIYFPQVFTRDLLNRAFGRGQWILVEHQTKVDTEHNLLYLEGSLYVRGNFVSKAWGEANYFPTTVDGRPNPNFSWASVHEAAKSDCITRCGKDLGIGKECWEPVFVRNWIDKYAIKVWRNEKKAYHWRRKDAPPFYDEKVSQSNNSKQQVQQIEKSKPTISDIEAYKKLLKEAYDEGSFIKIAEVFNSFPDDVKVKLENYKATIKEQLRKDVLMKPITLDTPVERVISILKLCKTQQELSEFVALNVAIIEELHKKYPKSGLGTTYKQLRASLK